MITSPGRMPARAARPPLTRKIAAPCLLSSLLIFSNRVGDITNRLQDTRRPPQLRLCSQRRLTLEM